MHGHNVSQMQHETEPKLTKWKGEFVWTALMCADLNRFDWNGITEKTFRTIYMNFQPAILLKANEFSPHFQFGGKRKCVIWNQSEYLSDKQIVHTQQQIASNLFRLSSNDLKSNREYVNDLKWYGLNQN